MTMTTAALLSSCGLYKSYERPADIQTDGLYRSDNTQSGDSLGLASFAWREIFTDPQLQTLIERGLAQNTNLRSAQLQIEQSEASLKAAKWAYIPSLAANHVPQSSRAIHTHRPSKQSAPPDTIQDETRSPPTPAAAGIAAQSVRLRSHLFFRQPIARLGKSFYICGPYQPLILGAKPRPGTSIR